MIVCTYAEREKSSKGILGAIHSCWSFLWPA